MLSPQEDFEQQLELELEPRTDSLIHVPRSLDYRNTLAERRQQIIQQKVGEPRTDALPGIKSEAPGVRLAWRQVIQLREENRHLHNLLEEMRREKEQLSVAYNALQTEIANNVLPERSDHERRYEQYQAQLQEVTAAYDKLLVENDTLRRMYDELHSTFQQMVEEKAHQMVVEAAAVLERSPDEVPVLLHDVVKSLQVRAQQMEDKHLIEILYLKHEVQRLAEELRQEREQVHQKQQEVMKMQYTVREQSELRRKTIEASLYARWRASLAIVATSLLLVFVVLQVLSMYLLRAALSPAAIIALVVPLVVCGVLAVLLSEPLAMARHIYRSAPTKRRVKQV
jgi:myosin heavy subunit